MYSKVFVVELVEDTDEFDVYEALRDFGIQYARVRPMERHCQSFPACPSPPPGRKPWEGIG